MFAILQLNVVNGAKISLSVIATICKFVSVRSKTILHDCLSLSSY